MLAMFEKSLLSINLTYNGSFFLLQLCRLRRGCFVLVLWMDLCRRFAGLPSEKRDESQCIRPTQYMYDQFLYQNYGIHCKKGSYRGILTYCQVEDISRDSGFPMAPAFADAFGHRCWSFHFEQVRLIPNRSHHASMPESFVDTMVDIVPR